MDDEVMVTLEYAADGSLNISASGPGSMFGQIIGGAGNELLRLNRALIAQNEDAAKGA